LRTGFTPYTGDPPKKWEVEVTYKTTRKKTTEASEKQSSGGESLYVVKTSEYPDSVFMMVRQATGMHASPGEHASNVALRR
jgi:hypothetical protein